MNKDLKISLSATEKWVRLVFMLLFGIGYYLASLVLAGIVFVQFLFVLFSDSKNEKLLSFSASLGKYIVQIAEFLSYQTESRPYPFSDWPLSDSPLDGAAKKVKAKTEKKPATEKKPNDK